jgi:hypothetical protein
MLAEDQSKDKSPHLRKKSGLWIRFYWQVVNLRHVAHRGDFSKLKSTTWQKEKENMKAFWTKGDFAICGPMSSQRLLPAL